MRQIYRKMFFEEKFLTDEEFFESDLERTSDRNDLHEEPSFNVDLQSTRNENILKDITNFDERKGSAEDVSDIDSSMNFRCDEDSDEDIEEMEQESCASNEGKILSIPRYMIKHNLLYTYVLTFARVFGHLYMGYRGRE